jgi:hypothetical protein
MPVAPWESLAIVSNNSDSSLVSSRATEESRDLQSGDLFVGNFGDNVTMKKANNLRIDFQNVGGLPARRGKKKTMPLDTPYLNGILTSSESQK